MWFMPLVSVSDFPTGSSPSTIFALKGGIVFIDKLAGLCTRAAASFALTMILYEGLVRHFNAKTDCLPATA
jgi:hypothetical protein